MTETELAAIEARGTPATACRNCGGSLDVDPAEDDAACPVHGYCWHCMTRGRHGRECRQSCTDVPVLIAEVRRLQATLKRVRDNEVVPTESRTGVICHVCHALGTVDRVAHDPDTACGIAQAALLDAGE